MTLSHPPSDRTKQQSGYVINPPAATKKVTPSSLDSRNDASTFHPISSVLKPLRIPLGILRPPSMQTRQAKLTRKRTIQIRVACGIALLLAIAVIVQYALMSSANNQKHPRHTTGRASNIPIPEGTRPSVPAAESPESQLGKPAPFYQLRATQDGIGVPPDQNHLPDGTEIMGIR
jgi:hypothetical protein